MSAENVEIAKRGIDALNRRDAAFDEYDEVVTPDYEFQTALASFVESGSYRGRVGLEAYVAEIEETWEVFHLLPDEFRDLGDRVLMLGRLEGRGKSSGALVDTPFGMVLDFRDGRISRSCAFLDHGEALRAAGLTE
jgi:ketosteroid isomerase-like protein